LAKAYWITCYRSITDQEALAAYAKLAGPAIQAAGGRFLVRGNPAKTFESGLSQRTVITEWESVAKAIAGHDSPGYQAALKALGKAAERDVRIVEGVG
jgi:uncharacterized protein (DUF1330 family)